MPIKHKLMHKTLLVDNYDSFTYNLFHLIAETSGARPIVVRNDEMQWAQLENEHFDRIIISPGPGRPQCAKDLGLSSEVIARATVPILGVCLGHQAIAHAFGATVALARETIHGRLSDVHHTGSDLFEGIPSPFKAVRYHSLAVSNLPDDLEVTAWSDDGTIMAIRHRTRPLWGVQFHPESICTEHGQTLMRRFYEIARPHNPPKYQTVSAEPFRLTASEVKKKVSLSALRLEDYPDPEIIFSRLFSRSKDAFWLDSSLNGNDTARFSYMGDMSGSRAKRVRYWAADRMLEVTENAQVTRSQEDIFDFLERDLENFNMPDVELPFDFHCGYVGYFSYELKGMLAGAQTQSAATPDACWIFADRAVVFDHDRKNVWLLCLNDGDTPDPANASWLEEAKNAMKGTGAAQAAEESLQGNAAEPITDLRWRHSPIQYRELIQQALELIRQGETYEVCLTNQLSATGQVDPFKLYRDLRRINPSPYACFMRIDDLAVLCSSPELFLSVSTDRIVVSKPIKGTASRNPDPTIDRLKKEELANSVKARSENLMIVDLLRNDLGRVCEVGSVNVPNLFDVETYASVHHLVTTVSGTLAQGKSIFDCIRAAFPGGSMTGAPKVRTMAIIDKLENGPRGIYSGSLGYLSLSGGMKLNIVIRTIIVNNSEITLGSGGAIVALSDPDEELEEVMLKLRAQCRVLNLAEMLPVDF